MDAATLRDALARLLHAPQELAALTTEARARRFKTWSDYACELSAWICELPRR
jgi:hypothetical protein